MPLPNSAISQKLGRLTPDIDDSDDTILGLEGHFSLPEEGDFKICLPDIDNERAEGDWGRVIAKLDHDFEALVDRIVKIRREVEDDVLKLHKSYFPKDEFTGSPKELVSHFRLKHVNYYGDGLVGLWYGGDMVFHCLDLNVELDPEWRIQFVNFDG